MPEKEEFKKPIEEESEYFKTQTEKAKLEIQLIKQEARKPFFKKKYFIQAVAASLFLAPILYFFIEPIFKLKEERLKAALHNVTEKLEISAKEQKELNILRDKLAKTTREFNQERKRYEDTLRKQEETIQNLLAQNTQISSRLRVDLQKQIQQSEESRVQIQQIGQKLQTEMVKTLIEEKAKPPKQVGWIYAGQYIETWISTNLQIGPGLPVVGEVYSAANNISIREDKPSFPFYSMKRQIGTVNKDTKVKVLEIAPDVGKQHVWIRIETL